MQGRLDALPIKVTKKQLIKDLKEIGIKKSDHIGIALSFKSIGYVVGGPEAFIEALLKVVGPSGTIMMPTYTRQFHLSKIMSQKNDYVFDYKSTPTWTGLVPEMLRNKRDSLRSKHPICSVAAVGKLAKYLTGDHDQYSSSYMPYYKLTKVGGKVLCIGLGDNIIALRHVPQYLAGMLNIVPIRTGVRYIDDYGKIKIFVRQDVGGCIKRLPEFVSIFRKKGFITYGKIGNSDSVLVQAKEFVDLMTEILKENPAVNLCDDISCLWCRELERRLDLYKTVQNPKCFQKYKIVIMIIESINWLRIRNHIANEIVLITSKIFQKISNIILGKKNIRSELFNLHKRWLDAQERGL